MKTFQILIVEDDQSVRNLITTTLKVYQYNYLTAATGQEAIKKSVVSRPDLVLLDLGLPDTDGMEVIRSIRSWSKIPIIVISARSEDSDKISALDEGADDYLTKPFSTDELMARIRVAQRRLSYIQSEDESSRIFQNGDLTIDYEAASVSCRGSEVHLTVTEYRLLKLMAVNVGKVLTYSMLVKEIWGDALQTDIVSLRVHMATLRKKIGDQTRERPLIETHVGIGYSMRVEKNA